MKEQPPDIAIPASSLRQHARQVLTQFQRSLFLPLVALTLAGVLSLLSTFLSPAHLGIGLFFQLLSLRLFDVFPLFLAMGLTYGLARQSKELFVLTAAGSYFILEQTTQQIQPLLSAWSGLEPAIDAGWVPGLIAAGLSLLVVPRTMQKKMPLCLAFFSGPRLAVLTVLSASLLGGALLGLAWHWLSIHTTRLLAFLLQEDALGAVGIGLIRPLLMPLGLDRLLDLSLFEHHGTHVALSGDLLQGETARFFGGDPDAGRYGAALYPLTMFALPAIGLAFIFCMDKGQRLVWSGFLALAMLPAILSGVSGVFLAFLLIASPLLYLGYAILSGVGAYVVWQLVIRLGFVDGPGLLEYLEHAATGESTHLLLSVGIVMFFLTFSLTCLGVLKLNLACPGRQKRTLSMRLEEIEKKKKEQIRRDEKRYEKAIQRTRAKQQKKAKDRQKEVRSDLQNGVRSQKLRHRLGRRFKRKRRGPASDDEGQG